MNGYLIDTNAISESSRPAPDARVMLWFERADPALLFTSVITLGELRMGIEALEPGKRREGLENWITAELPQWFATNLLAVSEGVSRRWATLAVDAKRKGKFLSTTDGLIAATAFEHNLTLVTRNVTDFEGLEVPLLNPWSLPVS